MTRPAWLRNSVQAACALALACGTPQQGRAPADSMRVPVSPAIREGSDTLQRFVLVRLNGDPLPTFIYRENENGGPLCADTTHAAHYELTGRRWAHETTLSSGCPPVERQTKRDSGQLEMSGGKVIFNYDHGGAIEGRLVGDSLIVEDGGPDERYVRERP